ncbi:aromatic acid exporter family protein [Naasia sp. SYSU D00057]|uniref:FUSC family protein n=1 Tax=Naasia sp. SYSU D00057 TaxID=2817380 RepID=UPI001B310A38|nr:aromatic acid exporter family protein [Naasia sp. SYSU D00057]
MRTRERGRPRWNLRQLLWWVWPTMPTSWGEVPARLQPAVVQIARLTIAATVAYVVADAFFPGILDLTAPLTALLVVQASTVGTLLMGIVRVGAVLTGVLVAIAITSYIGLSWWSLAIVIAASLILAKLLRLGDQTLEAPISGMLILAVSAPGIAGEVRVANTLIGTVVGIAFSLLVPVAIPNAQASEAVRRVTRSQAALMDEVALTLGHRPPHPEEVRAWLDWTEHIEDEIDAASAAVATVRESRRLNPRALATATVHPGLEAAVDRLDRSLAAERALIIAIGRQVPGEGEREPDPSEAELSRAFAVVLDDVADGLRAFGDLVDAEYGRRGANRADDLLERTLEIVRETRAVLTELMLLDVDPREQTELWMLHGSVLAALDHVIAQLDLERTERSTEPWLSRRIPALRTARGPGGGRRADRADAPD